VDRALDDRVRGITALLTEIDTLGDLSKVIDNSLVELARRLEMADRVCRQIKERHQQKQPSAGWLLLSIAQTVGSLAMSPVTPAALVLAVGGVLGTAKSIYDFNAHNLEASAYFALHWRVDRLRLNIGSLSRNRGLPPRSIAP
jgi:hypothetical protein